MIRINLVAEGRKQVSGRRSGGGAAGLSSGAESAAFWAVIVVLAVTVVGYGGYWLMLDREIERRSAEIAEARAIMVELQEIINEVERFTRRKAELEHRIQVISELRDNQRGPVRIMDQVSRALPDLLWLGELSLNARAVTISGQAFTTNSIASFIENLERVREFQEPVLKGTTWNGQVYQFQIIFNYRVVPIRSVRETAPAVAAQ